MSKGFDLMIVHSDVATALAKLAKLFTAEMRLTFIARHPENPECELMVGDDTPEGVIGVAERMIARKSKEEHGGAV